MRWSDVSRPWGCPLNNRRCANPASREGYVSLLAMSLAFGLAVFGTALAVGLRAYLSASVAQERDIRTRIVLESAAAELLGQMAAGRTVPASQTVLGGRVVVLEVSQPMEKLDFIGDGDDVLVPALTEMGVGQFDRAILGRAADLTAVSQGLRLSAEKEDCLRRAFTYGRAPAPMETATTGVAAPGLAAGDQVDIRVSLRDRNTDRVLWIRARFSGRESGWALHDYRLIRGVASCKTLDS